MGSILQAVEGEYLDTRGEATPISVTKDSKLNKTILVVDDDAGTYGLPVFS